MFKSLALVSTLAVMAISSANADQPRVEPGPVQEVSPSGLALLDAVLDHSESLADVARYGGEILAVSAESLTELTRYRVFVGTCTIDPAFICFAKAELQITRGFIQGRLRDTVVVKELRSPRVVPADLRGKLEDNTAELVEALMHVPAGVNDLRAHGNAVFKANVQHMNGSLDYLNVMVRQCPRQDFVVRCLGGANLRIEASKRRDGMRTRTFYETNLTLIRG